MAWRRANLRPSSFPDPHRKSLSQWRPKRSQDQLRLVPDPIAVVDDEVLPSMDPWFTGTGHRPLVQSLKLLNGHRERPFVGVLPGTQRKVPSCIHCQFDVTAEEMTHGMGVREFHQRSNRGKKRVHVTDVEPPRIDGVTSEKTCGPLVIET